MLCWVKRTHGVARPFQHPAVPLLSQFPHEQTQAGFTPKPLLFLQRPPTTCLTFSSPDPSLLPLLQLRPQSPWGTLSPTPPTPNSHLTKPLRPRVSSPSEAAARPSPLTPLFAKLPWGPLPRTGGPSSFPPRTRPLGAANGGAPAHWDPSPNCRRAPPGVAVPGLSRSHTRTLNQGSQKVQGEGKREKKGQEGKESGQRAPLVQASSLTPGLVNTSYCY